MSRNYRSERSHPEVTGVSETDWPHDGFRERQSECSKRSAVPVITAPVPTPAELKAAVPPPQRRERVGHELDSRFRQGLQIAALVPVFAHDANQELRDRFRRDELPTVPLLPVILQMTERDIGGCGFPNQRRGELADMNRLGAIQADEEQSVCCSALARCGAVLIRFTFLSEGERTKPI